MTKFSQHEFPVKQFTKCFSESICESAKSFWQSWARVSQTHTAITDLKQYTVSTPPLEKKLQPKIHLSFGVNPIHLLHSQQCTSHQVTLSFENQSSSTYPTHSTESSVGLSPENDQSSFQCALRNETQKVKKPHSLHRPLNHKRLQEKTPVLKTHTGFDG